MTRRGHTDIFALAALLLTPATLIGSPPEQVIFNNVPSAGLLNSPENAVRLHTFEGGYALGKVHLSGTLISKHNQTWRTDSRILITPPQGELQVFQPFTSGTTFSSLPFNRTIFISPGIDPAGEWSFRFFEFFDDSGPGKMDAMWDITITLTDEPPEPPSSVAVGTILDPGTSSPGHSIPSSGVRWYKFSIPWAADASLGTWLDIDTFGSTIPGIGQFFPDDTIIGLYDDMGELVAIDDDSGPGFVAQLSFGTGGRAPLPGGLRFDGQNGTLPAGTYYLAVGAFNVQFNPSLWGAEALTSRNGTLHVNFATNMTSTSPCYANCDGSTTEPLLTVDDFTCFINAFAQAQGLPHEAQVAHYANCDGSTTAPALTVDDFTCFINRFAPGCP